MFEGRSATVRIDVLREPAQDVIVTLQYSLEHLTACDLFGILVEFEVLGPLGAQLFPREKRLTHDDWKNAYRAACRNVLVKYRDLLIGLRMLHFSFVPVPDAVDHAFNEILTPWKASTLKDVLGPDSNSSPRLEAIRVAIQQLEPAFPFRYALWTSQLPRSATKRKPRPREGRRLRSIEMFTLFHEMWLERPDLAFVGDDGRWYLNGRALKDRSRDRRKDSARSHARQPAGLIEEHVSCEKNPEATAMDAETIEAVRAIRSIQRDKGAPFRAAIDAMEGRGTREELARIHGTTVKRIRRAEAAIRTECARKFALS